MIISRGYWRGNLWDFSSMRILGDIGGKVCGSFQAREFQDLGENQIVGLFKHENLVGYRGQICVSFKCENFKHENLGDYRGRLCGTFEA